MTYVSRRARHRLLALAAPLMLAGALAAGLSAAPSAAAAGCQNLTGGGKPPNPGATVNVLFGVTMLQSCDAWAAGFFEDSHAVSQSLLEHWTSKGGWKPVTINNPGGAAASNRLTAVTATSHNDAWAVGVSTNGGVDTPLILHYDGKTWKQVPAPAAPGFQLAGVAASSRANAWAAP